MVGTEIKKIHSFGQLKSKFCVIGSTFRHSKNWFNPIFRFCCALQNLESGTKKLISEIKLKINLEEINGMLAQIVDEDEVDGVEDAEVEDLVDNIVSSYDWLYE
eukprot:TRINITY_DN1798_c0_g1_i8.p1 TRINITY_DN1798_c0_g1~~TRINITY_DN1798_c0_g1_i8.p1  ORF type:complete len:104 (-),score=9.31 TRINITY_DN1798_c0_g1_i8:121-432(-)